MTAIIATSTAADSQRAAVSNAPTQLTYATNHTIADIAAVAVAAPKTT